MTTCAQFRAARATLNWTLKEAAANANTSVMSVRRAETDTLASPSLVFLQTLREAYETAGVEFIEPNGGGAGVRMRR